MLRISMLSTLFLCCCVSWLPAEGARGGMHPYPLWPSEPIPGWAGAGIDDDAVRAQMPKAKYRQTPMVYGQPEFLAYPGAVHHLRHFAQRYVPPYPVNNHKTLSRNFVLHKMNGYAANCVDFAEPVYYNPMYGPRIPTSRKRVALKAYPWKPGREPIKLALGELDHGVYILRPIVAAPSMTAVSRDKFIAIKLRINDVPGQPGKMNGYIVWAPILDNFYAVQEFCFHSQGDGRSFKAELALLADSDVDDVLLYNIDLHNRLGDLARRGRKQATAAGDITTLEEQWKQEREKDTAGWEAARKKYPARSPEQQREFDDLVWRYYMPPPNSHFTGWGYYLRGRDRSRFALCPIADEIREDYAGYLNNFDRLSELGVPSGRGDIRRLFVEIKDDKSGRKPGAYYDSSVADLMQRPTMGGGMKPWRKFGLRRQVRDAAMKFVRFVYEQPAVQAQRSIAAIAGYEGLDRGLLKYVPDDRGVGPNPTHLGVYNSLHDFLAVDTQFAVDLGRHLPWIKTPVDVIAFVDTYLVQIYANNVMKYRTYTDHGQAELMMSAVLCQNDTSISDAWMEFLFMRGWEYPQAMSGLGDNLASGTDRDGATTIGSFYYGLSAGSSATMGLVEQYLARGGSRRYDVTDPRQYPALRLKPYFAFEGSACGRMNPGIGDVGGPAEPYSRFAGTPYLRSLMESGWKWHKDPKFAWELVHTYGSEDPELVNAAGRCPRDPYLMTRSRALSGWGGSLTAGVEDDNFRNRREAAIRVGTGFGHAHQDTLDLRLFAYGCTMANDFNQRPGYGRPGHASTFLHNLVHVERGNWQGHAWIGHIFDAPGSRYLVAESIAPYGKENVKLYRRQCALIDVREADKATDTLPSSYLMDVFRVSGGSMHTYCFHGCADDGFEANVKDKEVVTGGEGSPDDGYLSSFSPAIIPADAVGVFQGKAGEDPGPEYWVARCDGQDLVATWRLSRKAEQQMLKRHGGADGPRKYTRLTLLDQADNKIMHATARNGERKDYYGRCLYAQRRAAGDMDTVFVALIEPYADQPSIVSQNRLSIENNESDALRAVAVEVKIRPGKGAQAERTDILFADGRPDRVRRAERGMRISAEYAYVSSDAQGLRQAALTGGTLLDMPGIKIEVENSRYEAKVVDVKYLDREVRLDGVVPERLAGHFFEVGNPGAEGHKTSYEVAKIDTTSRLLGMGGRCSVLTMRKGLEIMRTRLRSVDPEAGTVLGAVAMLRHRGRDRGLVASNDGLTRFWRFAYTGGNRHEGHTFALTSMDAAEAGGSVFSESDFPVGAGLRVWEFGAGDVCSIRTGVSLRRAPAEDGVAVYEVHATTPFTLTVKGAQAWTGTDRKTWVQRGRNVNGSVQLTVSEEVLSRTGKLYIKIK